MQQRLGGSGGVRGLGFCMGVLVGLQYMGTLPTVHGYILFFLCHQRKELTQIFIGGAKDEDQLDSMDIA